MIVNNHPLALLLWIHSFYNLIGLSKVNKFTIFSLTL